MTTIMITKTFEIFVFVLCTSELTQQQKDDNEELGRVIRAQRNMKKNRIKWNINIKVKELQL